MDNLYRPASAFGPMTDERLAQLRKDLEHPSFGVRRTELLELVHRLDGVTNSSAAIAESNMRKTEELHTLQQRFDAERAASDELIDDLRRERDELVGTVDAMREQNAMLSRQVDELEQRIATAGMFQPPAPPKGWDSVEPGPEQAVETTTN